MLKNALSSAITLSQWKGNQLFLNGLAKLDRESALALSSFKGDLELNQRLKEEIKKYQ